MSPDARALRHRLSAANRDRCCMLRRRLAEDARIRALVADVRAGRLYATRQVLA